MSELWRVRVEDREGPRVRLAVQAIHPDAGDLPGSKIFAFRLLADEAMERLSTEDGSEAYWDDALMTRRADEVIASVAGSPDGILTLDLSDPSWADPLRPGLEWETAAYGQEAPE